MSITNAIEVKNLTKSYKKGFMLDNISFTLPSGCIMGLIGENGAGKSTAIKLMLNMIKRNSGTVKILGRDNREDFELTKEDIGVVLDEVGISECLNAKEVGNIMKHTFKNWDEKVYAENLQKLSLSDNKKFKEFSKGMKMKLGIAVALSHNAKLLILDEATAGLDPVIRDEIMDMLCEFTREETHSVLISSHIVSDLEKVCDYIAFIHNGKMLICEEKDRLYETYGIVRCSAEQLNDIEPDAVIGKKISPYGAEAIVERSKIPSDWEIGAIDIEKLFVFMVKEGH